MPWTEVNDYRWPDGWTAGNDANQRARQYCELLERGELIYFKDCPYDLPAADREFLLSQKQSSFKGHKNISYRPSQDMLRGAAEESPEAAEKLHDVMRRFSRQVTQFLSKFLAPYAPHWQMDFASYRPLEEQNRDLPLHKRNDLTHVDAFPTRPTYGGRILRCFININPQRNRVWEITEPFEVIAKKYADDAGLKKFAADAKSPTAALRRTFAPIFKAVGVKGMDRTAYDRFMLRFHDYLKENTDYQQKWPKQRLEFPPGSVWMVYTDTVPHAVLSGQYAMEQTYIVPLSAMVAPRVAPIRVLEDMCGTALGN
ncbi:MAG TPA: Kdo hydroxylase family protein [Tepidisphaeraceae bacterium]|nr:Kdo hydroxylase family protein [Tepidisphaeraceae bacterium]